MKFSYLWEWFEYCLKKYARPKKKIEIKPRSTLFSEGAAKSHMDAVTVSTDCQPFPHSTAPPLSSDVEDHAHTLFQLSHPPNITSLNFRTDLVMGPSSSHMYFVLRPPSSHLGVPLDDTVSCSSILDSSLVVNEEQATNGVGVVQST